MLKNSLTSTCSVVKSVEVNHIFMYSWASGDLKNQSQSNFFLDYMGHMHPSFTGIVQQYKALRTGQLHDS